MGKAASRASGGRGKMGGVYFGMCLGYAECEMQTSSGNIE